MKLRLITLIGVLFATSAGAQALPAVGAASAASSDAPDRSSAVGVAPAPPVVAGPSPGALPPSVAPWNDARRIVRVEDFHGGPIPPGVGLRTERRIGLIIAGGTIFLGLYFVGYYAVTLCPTASFALYSTGSSAFASCLAMFWLYIPAVGPFIALTDRNLPYPGLVALDGILQTGGLALMIAGVALERRQLLYYAEGPRPPRHPRWGVLPMAPGATAGVSVVLSDF